MVVFCMRFVCKVQQLLGMVSQARASIQAQKPSSSSSEGGWFTWLIGAEANVDYNTTRYIIHLLNV